MSKDKRDDQKHPMQPVALDGKGVMRFKENRIVRWLLDEAGQGRRVDLNLIAREGHAHGFTADDHMQFAQLIGYSVSGYSELSYVTDASYSMAARRSARAGKSTT